MYILRKKATVVTARQTDTHRIHHFRRDSGLTKLEICPGGGGMAGTRLEEDVMILSCYKN